MKISAGLHKFHPSFKKNIYRFISFHVIIAKLSTFSVNYIINECRECFPKNKKNDIEIKSTDYNRHHSKLSLSYFHGQVTSFRDLFYFKS